jgi:PKD repeat protein
MDMPSTPNPAPQQNPASVPTTNPAVSTSIPAPAATVTSPAPAPVPVKPLTPEEKAAKRKAMFKRLGVVAAIAYAVILLGIFAWALLVGQSEVSTFEYLPITQAAWGTFLMKLFNIMVGILVTGAFFTALFGFIKSLLTKKEDAEKKKKASKVALWSGVSFFILTIAWLAGIWFLGPKLVAEVNYGSPIKTTPENPLNLTTPVEVTFDASEIPVDEKTYKILSYSWDFGDGETSNGMTTTHTYTHKAEGDGVYTVTLTVKYMDLKSGEQFEDQYNTQVGIANETTAAAFTVTPDSGETPLEVHFDATSSYDPDGEIVAYEWDMNDDGKFDDASGEEVDYTFTQEGDYDVTLRVSDNSGAYNTATKTIKAGSIGGLRAVITSSAGENGTYTVGDEYEFNGQLSQIDGGKIVKYTWNFGDGSKSVQSRTVKHAFEEAGTYSVTLSVADADGNTDEALLDVTVTEEGSAPVAKVSTTPAMTSGTVSGPVPLQVVFDGGVSTDADDDIVEYEWDFDNDGSVDDTGNTASYTYQEVGSFTALLTVTDSVGNQDELSIPVTVTEQGILANLVVDQTNGEVPLTVRFDASGSTYKEGSIVSYTYNFGDGSAPYTTGSSVTYKYNDVGNYTASVTVTGSDGKTATSSVQIVVRPVALTACFTVNTSTGSAPLFISVDPSCSTGTIETYAWDFGDGVISYDHKPELHTYETPGSYTIKLEVTSPEGIVSDFENTITVK